MPSSKLVFSSEGLGAIVPLEGACLLGLFGLALAKCVRAEADGNSGTVSTTSEDSPFNDDVFGVEVTKLEDVFNRSGAPEEAASSSTTDFGRNFRP